MANSEERWDKFVSLFKEKLVGAKGNSSVQCPVCGKKAWDVVSADLNFPISDWDEPKPNRAFRAVPFICKTCGFIASFAQREYEDKVESEK